MRAYKAMLQATAVLLVACTAWSASHSAGAAREGVAQQSSARASPRADGLAAWQQVYSVLTHPRCLNCHTATNYPQQGDDGHRHFANVVYGPGGQSAGYAALAAAAAQQPVPATVQLKDPS
jgi:hypothetical protein